MQAGYRAVERGKSSPQLPGWPRLPGVARYGVCTGWGPHTRGLRAMSSVIERNLVFSEIAVRNRLLSREQAAAGLRACHEAIRAGAQLELADFCLQQGYLTLSQVQALVRARNFMMKHRRDLAIARKLLRGGLVSREAILACFRMQENAYYQGELVMPRLLDILEEKGVLSREDAETALSRMGERKDEAPLCVVPFQEEVIGDGGGLDSAPPEKTGQFRVAEILGRISPDAGPAEPRISGEDIEDGLSGRQASRVKIPRAFYRFIVPGSYVEFTEDSWYSLLHPSVVSSPLVNISLGGLQIVSPHVLDVGERLRLALHIPCIGEELPSKGEVRWLAAFPELGPGYRVGIEFTRVPRATIEQLRRLAHKGANPAEGSED